MAGVASGQLAIHKAAGFFSRDNDLGWAGKLTIVGSVLWWIGQCPVSFM